ncbi:MAG: M20/M25/M40 family metallo-hydrolase [Patescibacteria group bacterium]
MDLLELATKLVSFNTVSHESSTVDMADFISNYLEGLGCKITQYPYSTSDATLKKVNLAAKIGGDESELAFAGHMDTVPIKKSENSEKDENPSRDPLELTLAGNNYYARGITDMKLFLAIAIKAAEALRSKQFKKPFALYFTSDEEVGCLGARKLVKENDFIIAKKVLIGEPTQLIPIYAHKGYIYATIEIFGKRGHSYDPRSGKSVIPALMETLEKLSSLESRFNQIRNPIFNPPYPTINIGRIDTDEVRHNKTIMAVKNTILGYCKLEIEIRYLPEQDASQVFNVMEDLVAVEHGEVTVKASLARNFTPPMNTPADSRFVKLIEDISGQKPDTVCYNTEGGVFNANGAQTVIFGPGSITHAHKPDEFIEKKYFEKSVVNMYSEIIREICCKG